MYICMHAICLYTCMYINYSHIYIYMYIYVYTNMSTYTYMYRKYYMTLINYDTIEGMVHNVYMRDLCVFLIKI